MNVFERAIGLSVSLTAAIVTLTTPSFADRVDPDETIVVTGNCLGGKVLSGSGDDAECVCATGTTELGDFCVSDDLANFFDDPWDTICEVYNCDFLDPREPGVPEMDICDAGNGFTCAEEFDNCRQNFATDNQVCQLQNEATARTSCEMNVWPNRSRFRNWHEVDGYYCPNPDDDPNDYNHWRFTAYESRCQPVEDVRALCMDAYLRDATAGSSGGLSLFGVGGSGGSGGEPAGALSSGGCTIDARTERDQCLEVVENTLSCPTSCDPELSPRLVLLPDPSERRRGITDGSTRDLLVAAERQNQEHSLTRLGYLFLDRGHIDNAIGIFRVLVDSFPDSANARHSLGEALEAAEKPELAAGRYREALSIERDFEAAQEGLSRASRPDADE